jgi:transposase
MVHVGGDLHKRLSQIAGLREDGELTQHRVANEPLRLERFFAEFPAHTPVAIEASGTWWWLVDLLEGLGHQPVLSHPKQTKAIAAARLKNDRVDAERLVLALLHFSARRQAVRSDNLRLHDRSFDPNGHWRDGHWPKLSPK